MRFNVLIRSTRWWFALVALSAGVVGASVGATRQENVATRAVTQDGRDWPSVGRTSDETYYSPLKQISDRNIDRLKLAWYIDLPRMPSAVSTPLAVGGTLYFAVGLSRVYAAEASSGRVLWTYDPDVPGATNEGLKHAWGIRGLAYADRRVFVGTQDGRLIALSADTGKPAWVAQTTTPGDGRYITGAPRVFKDKVIIGHGGADGPTPLRGYVTAYDAATGKQAWRFYLVPGDPAKGFENKAMEMAAKTWSGQWWKNGGGGTAWNAITFDAKYNRIYVGTGNGQPWNRNVRSPGGGDNLFLCSIVALDADTGEYVWHYQTSPGESWDFNSAMDIQLATLPVGGKSRDVILHAPKNGFFYVLDRSNGKLLSADPFVSRITWATHVDLATGRPVETPEARLPAGQALLYPGGVGAHSWYPMSFSPKSGLVYIPSVDLPGYYNGTGIGPDNWRPSLNPNGFNAVIPGLLPEPGDELLGSLKAWDPVKRKLAWSIPQRAAVNGGVLSTGGNLVFQGTSTGAFEARAADTGALLWSIDAQNGVVGTPVTYEVAGKQHVTVIAGYAGTPGLLGPLGAQFGWQYETQHRRVLTFVLDGKAALPPPEALVRRQPTPDASPITVDSQQIAGGNTLYTAKCLICHGAGAVAGGSAPDLRMSAMPLSAAAFASVVRDGILRSNGMAKFDEMSPAEVESIRQYVRSQARETLAKQAAITP